MAAAGPREITVIVRMMTYSEVEAEVRQNVTARLQKFHDLNETNGHTPEYLAGLKAGLLYISGGIDKPLFEKAE